MPASPLPNYLLSYRKRLALSQEELSFLLGTKGPAKVSRYESFAREPALRTILACEAVFDCPARELFAGVYKEIARDVAKRAATLLRGMDKGKSSPLGEQKRKTLGRIAGITANPRKP